MSKMGKWILELEEEAYVLPLDEFVKRYGNSNAEIWHRINSDQSEYTEPDYED